jgi:molybdopterin converting factor small subunit
VKKLTVRVEVDFVSVLRKLVDKENVALEFNNPVTVRDIVSKLVRCFSPAFKQALMDPELNDPRPSVIVLVNEQEIGVLQGLETRVGDGDRLTFIPVSHGG